MARFFVALVLLCALGASTARITHRYKGALNHRLGGVRAQDPPMPLFQSVLDHNGASNATISLRYLVNATHFNGNGPVLFMLGGEGPISPAYTSGHFIINDHAQEFGGMIVALGTARAVFSAAHCIAFHFFSLLSGKILSEHRFYGDSLPNGPGSDTPTELLQFLSSQQALADAALFQEFIITQYNLTSQNAWVVYGGSYSGCLSAWAKLKYPSLVSCLVYYLS